MTNESDEFKDIKMKAEATHHVWNKLQRWLIRNYGKDLYGPEIVTKIPQSGRRPLVMRYKNFNELEFSRRLSGPDVIERVEKYVKRSCPEIKVIRCDDSDFSGSILLLIPHPLMGVSVIFIPQQSKIQNNLFLYSGHITALINGLNEMIDTYDEDDRNWIKTQLK